MIISMQAAIFDLDGVIVDTAKYHYLAWKRLANELGFDFTEHDNERLKGVSRTRSLEILLEIGGVSADDSGKQSMMERKNGWYVEYISKLDASEILPGADDYLRLIRSKGVGTALASASKNAALILDRLNITPLFDVVVDGSMVQNSKPDPEAFVLAANKLGIDTSHCVVFEDAEAGVEAAARAGMGVVGIGKPNALPKADMVIAGLYQLVALVPEKVAV
jgi:beta-phosphoglucomutase